MIYLLNAIHKKILIIGARGFMTKLILNKKKLSYLIAISGKDINIHLISFIIIISLWTN